MSFGQPWSYTSSGSWKQKYPAASGKEQSPINIDTNKVVDCDMLCKIALKFAPSKCNIRIQNKTPLITFDSGSYIKFVRTREIMSLKSASVHVPSMHTINGVQHDMEIILYYKIAGNMNPTAQNYTPGGVAVSILFQRGVDYGPANNFFNAFVHKLPNDRESVKEYNISVGDKWSAESVIPVEKQSYFYYHGSLPFPPCEENWRWIVFEDIVGIGGNIIDTLSIAFNGNIRPIKALGTRAIAYNANITLPIDSELDAKSQTAQTELSKLKSLGSVSSTNRDETEKLGVIATEKKRIGNWYSDNKIYIKGLVITAIMLLTIFAALKLVKYIVSNDLLNKVMVMQALGSSKPATTPATAKSASPAANNQTAGTQPLAEAANNSILSSAMNNSS